MKILITGAKGFVGRNLAENLKNIRDGKNRTRPGLTITEVYEYDVDSEETILQEACEKCDFVFHLAGVNRPKDKSEFMKGNFGFSSALLEMLQIHHNTCPVMLASSIQASLTGRYADSEYGKSKLAGEELFFQYASDTGAKVLVYRFPNVFGKWCRPNYNSAVATFCNAVANDEAYTVSDPSIELELLYIDDLVEEMLDALEGKEHRCEYSESGVSGGAEAIGVQEETQVTKAQETETQDTEVQETEMQGTEAEAGRYCHVPVTYKATLGEIVSLLNSFRQMPETLVIPQIPQGSFAKKLYSTYLSYLPASRIAYGFRSNVDNRGNFTELIRTMSCGQISINVAKPGITRGQHWHNSKWEIFVVVSGHGLIQERRIGIDPDTGKEYPVIEFEVTGEQMRAIQMLPGYAHNIINLSTTENLVTVMWANEPFDETRPDTFFEAVEGRNASGKRKGKGNSNESAFDMER